MIALGFDPGSTDCGFALASRQDAGRRELAYIAGGKVSSHPHALAALPAFDVLPKGATVAIETPKGGIYGKARGPALLETTRVAGDIAGMVRGRGYGVFALTAAEARRALCGRRPGRGGSFGDADVSRALRLLVPNLPRVSVHVRDALLVAVLSLLNPNAERM